MTAFVARALQFFSERGICAERLMTDNAWAYTHNRSLRDLLDGYAIRHIRTRPYTPRTNGKVERYQQTLQREWAYALQYASRNARRASLPHLVRHYNERRTHSALGNPRSPPTRSGGHRAQHLARRVESVSRRGAVHCRSGVVLDPIDLEQFRPGSRYSWLVRSPS